MTKYDQEIMKFYQDNANFKDLIIEQKIITVSNLFLGKPYNLGALGEGPNGEFDQNPLYRTDSFDCQTFVSTVLALANSSNLSEFQNNIKNINYKDGNVSYFNRAHFTNLDWNTNNQHNNFLEDYTSEIVDETGKPIAESAYTLIDKPNWFTMKNCESIKSTTKLSANKKQNLLNKLHGLAANTSQEKSVIAFLPLNKLFSTDGTPNQYLFDQIPSPSVIEIVTPNLDLYNKIGTNLDVSHLGIAFRRDNQLIFREASSYKKFGIGVIDIPLIEYLKNYQNSKTIAGINVQKIL